MNPERPRGGLLFAMLLTGAVGAAVIGGTLALERPAADPDVGPPHAATAEYGQRLLRQTAAFLGPDHENPDSRYSGTRMACASCHLDTGTKPGTLSLLQSATRYPRYSGRDGGIGDLRDRINGCMQRSMNGRALPRDSVEMLAMETYVSSLGDRFNAMGETKRAPTEPEAFVEPDRAANPAAGRIVYQQRCQVCHGSDGAGLQAAMDPNDGYLFPPLWGPDSYNDGAGMHRVLTAARFIKARMPFGEAELSDDQAFDVAAYINSQPRPQMSGLDRDYPDRTQKPIDSPYPPYADPFPRDQHRYGPFGPIREYYKRLDSSQSAAEPVEE